MSETAPVFEKQEKLEAGGKFEITAHTEHAPTPEQVASEKQQMSQESRATIAEEAPTLNVIEAFQADEAAKAEPVSSLITPELKAATKQRQLSQVQRRLSPRSRTLSKVIHQPAVRIVSEAAAATISRPSGLLGGGLVAFIGSLGYLYLTKHVGMTYNYFVFTLLFVGGFALGLVLELIVWSLTASRRRTE
jgi:hypothetical protein